MRLEPGYLFGMALQTVPEPRKVARDLFDLNLPRETLWTALALVVVVNAALGVLAGMMFPLDAAQVGSVLSSPVLLGVIEASFMFGLAWGIYVIGRMFGGQGSLSDAIITVVWMEFIFLMVQALTLLLTVFAPGLAAITMIASIFLFFWVLSHFTTESHGFASTGMVFASILGFMILTVFALSFLLVLLGVEPAPMTLPN
ncbi:YIP1 family protein [Aliiroseovarius zhejiangensis]|uniref:YIP1 family protein n=1 Tax=Aliiroseovarius zhejiangensis TaxID=1632025 RepID=A0ABQ3IL26_9RHOB|nr:YIP1 family protein [Aliiroseovarius zhejiangensis]GHE85113.1 YIP1 family protein [Aliiroseovarius zhejiangensis]